MVKVKANHFGRPAGGAARFYCACGTVAYFKERHEPRRIPSARKFFVIAPDLREVSAHTRSVFKNPGLAHPKVHNAALVNQVVIHRKDKAGMRLRALVGRGRFTEYFCHRVYKVMPLRFAGYAIRAVQTCIEPLRRVWGSQLPGNGVNYFIIKYIGILFRCKVAVAHAPILPAISHAMGNLLNAFFGSS